MGTSSRYCHHSTFLTTRLQSRHEPINVNDARSVADSDYDAELEKALVAACEKAGGIELADSWRRGHEEYKASMSLCHSVSVFSWNLQVLSV